VKLAEVPVVEGPVPKITPLAESSVRPLGSVPLLTDQLHVPVPPEACRNAM
jgi:hypothetical protein